MGTSSEQRRDEWMVSSKAGEGSVEKKPVGGSWQRSWKGVGMEESEEERFFLLGWVGGGRKGKGGLEKKRRRDFRGRARKTEQKEEEEHKISVNLDFMSLFSRMFLILLIFAIFCAQFGCGY